jgi:hypothetical protein
MSFCTREQFTSKYEQEPRAPHLELLDCRQEIVKTDFQPSRRNMFQRFKRHARTRRTKQPESLPLALSADFYQLPNKRTQWAAFLSKH